jgi:hypothetical protein
LGHGYYSRKNGAKAFNNTITGVGIPEFRSLGSVIGQNIAGILVGKTSFDPALKANQPKAKRVMKQQDTSNK